MQKPGLALVKGKLINAVTEIKRRAHIDFNNEADLREIIDVLGRDRYSKTPQDLEILRMAFSRFSFFQDLESKMGADAVMPLYKELTYEKMNSRQTVFNLGDLGRKFYIILKGQVYVLVKKRGLQDGTLPTQDEINQEAEEKKLADAKPKRKKRKPPPEDHSSMMFVTSLKPKNRADKTVELQPPPQEEDEEIPLTDPQFIEKRFPYFMQVGVMGAGDSFGEIALTKQMPRTATILCKEETHFVTLTRESFNKLLSEYYQIIQQINVRLLQRVSMFSDWNEPMLNQLYYHFTFKDFKMNQTIYRENEEASEIYLVKEGEVELSQMMSIPIREANENEKLLGNFAQSPNRFTCKSKRIKSALITVGQIFGQEDVLADTKRRSMAVCVSDQVKLFVLDKHRFLTYCQRGRAIEKVRDTSERKREWRAMNEDTIYSIERPPLHKKVVDERITSMLLHKRVMSLESISKEDQSQLLNRKVSTFVIPKLHNVVERISDKGSVSSFKLLQDKTHVNSSVGNFNNNYQLIRQTMKPMAVMDLQSGFFNLDKSKSTNITLLRKVQVNVERKALPGALRDKYEIPKHQTQTQHLVRHLKLPSVLKYLDTEKLIESEMLSTQGLLKQQEHYDI